MDFMLTEQQQMMKKLFAEFAEKEVKPLAHEMMDDCIVWPRTHVQPGTYRRCILTPRINVQL